MSEATAPDDVERGGPQALARFERHRDRLFGLAYRMTGSVTDADDVVQDAWLRWARTDTSTVDNAEAWLVRTATNLCLDRLRSAQHRREQYVGPWLPEPLVGESEGPADRAITADSLTLAFLVVLDELDPADRAVFLLHEVFAYPFGEIAAMVGRSPDACRQAASRARRRVESSGAVHRRPERGAEERLLADVMAALGSGDVDAVMSLMAPDVVVVSDGGSERRAARRPVIGPERSARLILNLAKRVPADVDIAVQRFNGDPTVVIWEGDEVLSTLTLEFDDTGLIRRVWAMRNLEKLRHLRH